MKLINSFNESQLNSAIIELQLFIKQQAQNCIARGWSYTTTSNAPETFAALKEQTLNKCIPVANYGSDKTIYNNNEINILFRFWHDVMHLELNEGFNQQGETIIAKSHFTEAFNTGLSDLALRLLWADTMGQVEYYFNKKQFVDNQKDFVIHCAAYGIKNTIQSQNW